MRVMKEIWRDRGDQVDVVAGGSGKGSDVP
jgi:hypothetical protein